MILTRRRPPVDPASVAALAAARAAETRAEVDRARALAELRREQAAAERAAALEAERDARRAKKEREAAREQERAERRAKLRARFDKARQVTPLIIINAASAYVQAAYAYENVAPKDWPESARIVLAVIFAAAGETIALYVQWHAHDALVQRAYGTAAKLRRASWTIAGVFASLNYSHFVDRWWEPKPAGIAVATFTLLSPWLWGLHTRRAQHMQLLAEDPSLIDSEGAQFSLERRRAFPVRSWRARRWSIDHGVRDPRAAWAGYNRERDARRGRQRQVAPVEGLDQNTATMLAIIRLQARRCRQAVTAGLPARFRTPAVRHDNGPAKFPDTAPASVPDTAPDSQPDTTSGRSRTRRTTSRSTADRTRRPDTTAARIARIRAQQPDITQADVAARLKVHERTVQRYWADTAPATKESTR